MVIEIKETDSEEEIKRKLKLYTDKADMEKSARIASLFGALRLKEDAVKMQRRWRDEW